MSRKPRLPKPGGGGRLRLILGLVAAMILAVLVPTGSASAATSVCSNQTGTNSGYYYQMWSAGTGSACLTLNSGNSYSTQWSGIGDFVAGVGWNPGDTSTKSFNGSLSANGGTQTFTFTQPGDYPYFCSIHPAMKAWIQVVK